MANSVLDLLPEDRELPGIEEGGYGTGRSNQLKKLERHSFSAALHLPLRIGNPLTPGAGIQFGVPQAGVFIGKDIPAGRNARAAIKDGVLRIRFAQGLPETFLQRSLIEKNTLSVYGFRVG